MVNRKINNGIYGLGYTVINYLRTGLVMHRHKQNHRHWSPTNSGPNTGLKGSRAGLSKLGWALIIACFYSNLANATANNTDQHTNKYLSTLNRFLAITEQPINTAPVINLAEPLSVGIALVAPEKNIGGIHYEDQTELLKAVQKRLADSGYVDRTEVIPHWLVQQCQRYACFRAIARQFNVTAVALVNYDQVPLSLADARSPSGTFDFITLTGRAHIIGKAGEIHTFVNTSLFIISSQQLLLSAAGYQATTPHFGKSPRENASALNFEHAKADMLSNLELVLATLDKPRPMPKEDDSLPANAEQTQPPVADVDSAPENAGATGGYPDGQGHGETATDAGSGIGADTTGQPSDKVTQARARTKALPTASTDATPTISTNVANSDNVKTVDTVHAASSKPSINEPVTSGTQPVELGQQSTPTHAPSTPLITTETLPATPPTNRTTSSSIEPETSAIDRKQLPRADTDNQNLSDRPASSSSKNLPVAAIEADPPSAAEPTTSTKAQEETAAAAHSKNAKQLPAGGGGLSEFWLLLLGLILARRLRQPKTPSPHY